MPQPGSRGKRFSDAVSDSLRAGRCGRCPTGGHIPTSVRIACGAHGGSDGPGACSPAVRSTVPEPGRRAAPRAVTPQVDSGQEGGHDSRHGGFRRDRHRNAARTGRNGRARGSRWRADAAAARGAAARARRGPRPARGASGLRRAAGAAGSPAERRALQGLRLRYGSARQAGLLERHLEGWRTRPGGFWDPPRTPLLRGGGGPRRPGPHHRPAPRHGPRRPVRGLRRADRPGPGVPGGRTDRDGRGHRLRPGFADQAVHLHPGRPADRARTPGTGGPGVPVHARVHRGRQGGHHGPSAAHAHLGIAFLGALLPGVHTRGAAEAAVVGAAAGDPRDRLPVFRSQPHLAAATAGTDHRSHSGHPAPRRDHRSARDAPHSVQPTALLAPGHRRHRSAAPALVRSGPRAGVG